MVCFSLKFFSKHLYRRGVRVLLVFRGEEMVRNLFILRPVLNIESDKTVGYQSHTC